MIDRPRAHGACLPFSFSRRMASIMSNSSGQPSSSIEYLYTQHHGWLVNWLRHKLANVEQAADLAQDTFTRLLVAERDGKDIAAREPRAFLATIANRLLINQYQRRALEQAYLEALAALPEPQVPSPEDQLVIFQALQAVDSMLSGLPRPVCRAFLLSQVDGLTYAEIAQQMNVTPRTIKRYMAQAFTQCILLSDS